MSLFDRIVEQQIMEAMQEGKFQNLRGQGKPLTWEENPHEPEETRLANHILREQDVLPPWLEKAQEIDAELARARQDVRPGAYSRQQFLERIAALNRKIRDYNLLAPLARFQRPLLNPQVELEQALKRPAGQE